ncbi:MAG TPA: hypothetical protein PLX30_09000 [Methanothrix sp.]|nr:hypothetical protein [Methanothrix sp.]
MTPKLFPILIIALIFIAPSSATAGENAVKIVHFINGARGDESFFDSAGEDYDVLITGSALMRELLEGVAPKHPDKTIIGIMPKW